jgi:cyclopropane fatty-acyl-phospholipid synthase-like methyltransferase
VNLSGLVLFFQIVLGLGFIIGLSTCLSVLWGAPWAPTPRQTMESMLRLADIQPGERMVDLGAGDGRLVIAAARKYQADAVGVEIDPLRCLLANVLIRCLGLQGRARVVWGNMYDYDLRGADVVMMYLLQRTNTRFWPKLARELEPGARVVSHSFTLPHWTPAIIDDTHCLFVYHVVPEGTLVQTHFVDHRELPRS